VADPGTSLITHRYIYFAGTLVSGLGQFRVTRYEFWLLRLHCEVHRLPGVVLWLRGRLAIRRLLAHD
jgi:hypothetical protein